MSLTTAILIASIFAVAFMGVVAWRLSKFPSTPAHWSPKRYRINDPDPPTNNDVDTGELFLDRSYTEEVI